MNKVSINSAAEIIDGFLATEECKHLISLAEQAGFADAPIISYGREVLAREVRNNLRVLIDDSKLASELWVRVQPLLGIWVPGWKAVGLNERFRFYRYEHDQMFSLHRDLPYETRNTRSFLSLIMYLNDDFEGGETEFEGFSVLPKVGRAAVFKHSLLHQGNAVKTGVKYAVRTDIMFCRCS